MRSTPRGTAVAWIRCDAAIVNPGRLLRHLVDALADAAPGVAEPVAEKLAGAPAPDRHRRARPGARGPPWSGSSSTP